MVSIIAKPLLSVRWITSSRSLAFCINNICIGSFHKEKIQWSTLRDIKSVQLTSIACELGKPATCSQNHIISYQLTERNFEGSSSNDTSTLVSMMQNGMKIAKINCSKASHKYYDSIIENFQAASNICNIQLGVVVPVALALETTRYQVHTGTLQHGLPEEVELKKGKTIKIVFTKCFEDKCSSENIWVSHPQLEKVLQIGSLISIDDKKIVLRVKKLDEGVVGCITEQGGVLRNRMPVCVPGVTLDCMGTFSLSETNHDHLQWGLLRNVDIVFASLTETSEGVLAIKNALGNKGKHIKIFAKIESLRGWKNFNDILAAADGIVVVRDGLSKFFPPEKMFSAQKYMISRCNEISKPVIVSGQVLSSMLTEYQPSMSECSDISTVVLHGADCVELSAETAEGIYPKETVAYLSRICREAETAVLHEQIFLDINDKMQVPLEITHASAISAVKAAFKSQAKSIVCVTRSGKTALLLAKHSPPCPVIAVTRDPQVAKACTLFRAILPIVYEGKLNSDWRLNVENNVRYAVKYGITSKFLTSCDQIIVICEGEENAGFTKSICITIETVNRYIGTSSIQ